MTRFIQINGADVINANNVSAIRTRFGLEVHNFVADIPTNVGSNVLVSTSLTISAELLLFKEGVELPEKLLSLSHSFAPQTGLPLIDSPAYLDLPKEAPLDKARLVSQEQVLDAVRRYTAAHSTLDALRAANVPVINPALTTMVGDPQEQSVVPLVPEPTMQTRRPTEDEIKLEKRMSALLGKINKALNRSIVVENGKVVSVTDRASIATNVSLAQAQELAQFALFGNNGAPLEDRNALEGIFQKLTTQATNSWVFV